MKQYYSKNEAINLTPIPSANNVRRNLDFALPQTFIQYIDGLNKRCELIRHLETYIIYIIANLFLKM